jgi:hypothetical protein
MNKKIHLITLVRSHHEKHESMGAVFDTEML